MILNQAQAQAIAKVMSELNNVGGRGFHTSFVSKELRIQVNGLQKSIGIKATTRTMVPAKITTELYASQSEFFSAYNLS